MKFILILTTVFILTFTNVFSQKAIENQRVWFNYIGQYRTSNHWGYHIEASFRLDNELKQNVQNLFRVGGIYYLSPNKNLTLGYSLINTYSFSIEDFFKENRVWEQFQYNKKWNNTKNTISHRFRLEQRWVEDFVKKNSNYQNRFRYLNRVLFHLANLKSENEEIYAVLQDEVFLTIGDNKINGNLFEQNRFAVGIGLNYNNNIRLELSYLNQFLNNKPNDNAMNHIVSVSLIQNLTLQKQ